MRTESTCAIAGRWLSEQGPEAGLAGVVARPNTAGPPAGAEEEYAIPRKACRVKPSEMGAGARLGWHQLAGRPKQMAQSSRGWTLMEVWAQVDTRKQAGDRSEAGHQEEGARSEEASEFAAQHSLNVYCTSGMAQGCVGPSQDEGLVLLGKGAFMISWI